MMGLLNICRCDRSGPIRRIKLLGLVGYCLQKASNSWKIWKVIKVHSP